MFKRGQAKGGLQPYVMGRWSAGRRLKYVCAACQRATVLEVSDWIRLPELTLADLESLGLEWMALDDLHGAGVTEAQVEQLVEAGIDPALEASYLTRGDSTA